MNPYKENLREYKMLVITLIILISLGMVMLFSASSRISYYRFGESNTIFYSHLTRMIAALLVGFFFYLMDYKFLKKLNVFFFFSALFILFYPLLFKWINHLDKPARWIQIGSLSFQTAEIAKFSLIIFFANYISKNHKYLTDFKKGFLPITLVLSLFIILIALAPDFSTAAVMYAIFMVILYVGGAKLVHIASVSGIFAFFGFLYVRLSHYRWERILSYFDPTANDTASYQINQSMIFLGNGGLLGRSLGNSYGKNMYLPEAHTDFIFSIIGEEIGFVGTTAFLILFFILFYTLYNISKKVDNQFAKIIIFTTAFFIISYALLNAAVCVQLLPVTGLPMPFVSYSGSQLIINGALIGIVLNIHKQEIPL